MTNANEKEHSILSRQPSYSRGILREISKAVEYLLNSKN